MGLLGTVVGMISVFTEITTHGTGNANALAGGISEALLTTAAGAAITRQMRAPRRTAAWARGGPCAPARR